MGREDHAHLLDALAAIDPATLEYQEWVDCGMALHESGFGWEAWDEWSRRDARRYHEGECEAKWRSFGNGAERVTSGTIVHLAEARGWVQPTSGASASRMYAWDDVGVAAGGPLAMSQAAEADSEPVMDADEGPWDGARMLRDYINALFDEDEYVGYVCQAFQRDGRWLPTKGSYSRTAGEICDKLDRYGDVALALESWEEEAGAWVRVNPLDGEGCGNANVKAYRYALVESDTLDMDKQLPAIRSMRLPCAAVVSSAGKSVHAIVHVDAKGFDEYRKRVQWLYDYCDRHGFHVDRQNKNPSRLSRLPGVTRNGRRQLLLATNEGEPDWESWRKWAEESEDDLPDSVVDDWDEPIRLKPMLIGQTDESCILRQGQKMILVGDSKMGKSTTLIDLSVAICVGGDWLGMKCARGSVFYVNLELDSEEFRDKRKRIWEDRPEAGDNEAYGNVRRGFVSWHMRGHATVMDEIAPRLVRRVLSYGPPGSFQAIIIDPIYKVNGGDDNDARAVARFTNMLDLIVDRCGCAVIYAHHHPKGATGGRKSIDRMSGSGVYGRDADTVIDFSPLFVPEDTWARYDYAPIYRAEVTCRSFGHRKPIDCIFRYPRFYKDATGDLAKCKVLGEDTAGERAKSAAKAREEQAEEVRDQAITLMREAMAACVADGIDRNPTSTEIFEHMPQAIRSGEKLGGRKVTLNRVKGWVKKSSEGFLGPFHNVNEDGSWGIIDDKTS